MRLLDLVDVQISSDKEKKVQKQIKAENNLF